MAAAAAAVAAAGAAEAAEAAEAASAAAARCFEGWQVRGCKHHGTPNASAATSLSDFSSFEGREPATYMSSPRSLCENMRPWIRKLKALFDEISPQAYKRGALDTGSVKPRDLIGQMSRPSALRDRETNVTWASRPRGLGPADRIFRSSLVSSLHPDCKSLCWEPNEGWLTGVYDLHLQAEQQLISAGFC